MHAVLQHVGSKILHARGPEEDVVSQPDDNDTRSWH